MQTLSLQSWHQQRGAVFGRTGRVARYSAVAEEYQLLGTSAGLLDFSDREALVLTGPDRESFLHGMVTQDITGLEEGHWAYTAFTTAKGAMVADGWVLKQSDALFVDLEPSAAEPLKAHLERFLISEDAEIRNASAERAVLELVGPAAPAVVEQAGLANSPALWVLRHELLGVPTFRLFVLRPPLEEVADALLKAGAKLAGEEAYDVRRIEAGVPRMGQDMDTSTIPLEADLSRAINYQKGCYVGQEVIARATFRGHVNKKLVGLKFEGSAPPAGTELYSGDKRMGRIPSTPQSPKLGAIGLGYVHRTLVEPGTVLAVPEWGNAVVSALPF